MGDSPGENAAQEYQEDTDEHLGPKFRGAKFLAWRRVGCHEIGVHFSGEGGGMG